MKIIQEHQNHKILYVESFWTGKKTLMIDDEQLNTLSKTSFISKDGTQYNLTGNFLKGEKLEFNGETISIIPPVKWYEVVLSILIFIFILIWGNSVKLCNIIPLVGGAIGGAISGALSVTNLIEMKSIKPVWGKILVFVGFFAINFLVCYLIAMLILL